MGLNGEVVSDINHLSLPYLPLCVTIDAKRGKDSADTGNKREKSKKGIGVDCDKDDVCRKQSCKTERGEERDEK